jgi:hypothetical protein
MGQMEDEFFAAVVAGSTTRNGRGTRGDGPPHGGEIVPRFLKDEDNKDGKSTFLVDANGNAYEPYALSWRYLGMYADCDLTYAMREIDGLNRRRRRQRGRQLGGGGNNNNNNKNGGGDDCSRKILWAAVRPRRWSVGRSSCSIAAATSDGCSSTRISPATHTHLVLHSMAQHLVLYICSTTIHGTAVTALASTNTMIGKPMRGTNPLARPAAVPN